MIVVPGFNVCLAVFCWLLVELQELEQFSDFVSILGGVSHLPVSVDEIAVAASDAFPFHEPGLDEVGDDSLRGALGDADRLSEVS